MHSGRFVFSPLMEHMPPKVFRRCVRRYRGDRHVRSFTCLDQFLCLAFAQLTHRECLRDIEVCLRAHRGKLYHMGIRGGMARNTLANANRKRDWRIRANFAQALIRIARPLYAGEALGLHLDNTVYALDSSTVGLCLSVFPWALFRSTKSGVKLHTLLDLRGNIPAFVHIAEAILHEVNVLDLLVPEPGAFYVTDRRYVDFERLFLLHRLGAFFVVRAKSNLKFRRRGQVRGRALRPNHRADRRRDPQALPSGATPRRVFRCEIEPAIRLSHQPLRLAGDDRRRTVPPPMAGGTILQMDQATPAHQVLFRHLGECRENPTMESRRGVHAGGHRQETPQPLHRSLHNSTGSEPDPVRTNPVSSTAYKNRIRSEQPALT